MSHPHRRDFVRALTLGASGVSLSLGSPAVGDEPKKDETPPREPPKSEADARLELVLARFGRHLNASARDSVRAEVEAIVHRARSLRKFPLSNGDGPLPVFTPYRAPLASGNMPRKDEGGR